MTASSMMNLNGRAQGHYVSSVQTGEGKSLRSTISAVLIVKNEEHVLEVCLASLVDWVDEIIILDSGSTDQTLQIASRYGVQVHVREDWPGFGIQRQRAQAFATGDYILSIDADERISPELQENIIAILENSQENTLYELVMQNSFLDKPYRNGWRREKHIRLFDRQKFHFNSRSVHESVDRGDAQVKTLGGFLIHDACQNYEYYLQKHLIYAHSWARTCAAEGKRVSVAAPLAHGLITFTRLFFLQGGFLDGWHGFLFAAHLSQYSFNKYAALWYYSRQFRRGKDLR